MNKGKLLLIGSLLVSTQVFGQFQFGNTIYENVTMGSDSRGIDISSDGKVIALLNSNDGYPFEVKVYEYVDNEWRQRGASISNFKLSPGEVLISGDGTTVFVNEILTIGVYKWSGTEWNKVKGPFDEDLQMAIDDFSISRSGERVAAYYDFYGRVSSFGLIGIFEWNGSEWDTIGSIIRIDQPFEFRSHKRVELSGDGLTLINGSGPLHLQFGGKAIAYRFDSLDWAQIGDTIQDSINRSVGLDISFSYDGDRLVTTGLGQIQAWSWDGQGWESRGLPIVGDDAFRTNVELDSTGNFLATASKVYSSIGDPFHGRIAIYELDNNKWTLTKVSANGEESGDLFGTHMAFSDNGEVIVGSSDRQWSAGENYVKAYIKSAFTSIPALNLQLGLSVYPNPASDMARVNANAGILRIDLIDIQGRQLRQEVYINGGDKTREIPVTGLLQGTYWLRVTTDEGVGTIPLMVK